MSLASFSFSSKANTLVELASLLTRSIVPRLRAYRCAEWKACPLQIEEEIAGLFDKVRVAVRSSADSEDGVQSSMAGAFLSLLDIDPIDRRALSHAIDRVCSAMPNEGRCQFFVQEMVRDVVMSGVIMTRDMTTGAPYYVINYDDESGRTDTVTGGTRINKTLYVFHDAPDSSIHSARVRAVVDAVREIDKVCGQPVDIEFALSAEGVFHLLQVRPVTTQLRWSTNVDKEVRGSVAAATRFLSRRLSEADAGLLGVRSLVGSMPDWNPAELIGQTPKPLAISLFRRFITRSVWREARGLMGYRNPPGHELMLSLMGRPYIDVRASFNSLLPKDLPDDLGHRLVSAWMENLAAHPEFHDKVEFEITQSSIDFSFDDRFDEKTLGRFSQFERQTIRDSLLALTRQALNRGAQGTLSVALRQLDQLRQRQLARPLGAPAEIGATNAILYAQALIEEGVQLGARPFAVVARHAFIAESFLRSAMRRGAISESRVALLRSSIHTVTAELAGRLGKLRPGQDLRGFEREFGHLRPGTFDIESPRYADRLHQLAGTTIRLPVHESGEEFLLSAAESANIRRLLAECGLEEVIPESLVDYLRQAIGAREFGKFVLSRNISDVLEYLAAWGALQGLERAKLAALPLEVIERVTWTVSRPTPAGDWQSLIEQAEVDHLVARAAKLPALIKSVDDVFVAAVQRALPNLFGVGVIRGEVCEVSATDDWSVRMDDKIVCIESADPGFDWIFATGAVALVTKYGGANSHMAIRCMEIGLPAAIGCGEQLYSRIKEAGSVELNFNDGTVKPLYDF